VPAIRDVLDEPEPKATGSSREDLRVSFVRHHLDEDFASLSKLPCARDYLYIKMANQYKPHDLYLRLAFEHFGNINTGALRNLAHITPHNTTAFIAVPRHLPVPKRALRAL
jgi:hypothetical protein